MNQNGQVVREDEIDLVQLGRGLWAKKWFIVKVTGVFVVLGLVIAFTSPEEYETFCVLIPETVNSEAVGGSLGGLASLAGINLGNNGSYGASSINPGLYNSIVKSTPFCLSLLEENFYFSKINKRISLFEYEMHFREKNLLSYIFYGPLFIKEKIFGQSLSDSSAFIFSQDSNIQLLSRTQIGVIDHIKEQINVTIDWELNTVTISAKMQDPSVAAEVANFTKKYITNYAIRYTTNKALNQLHFVEEQYMESKSKFEKVQQKLADFKDNNKNVLTESAKIKEQSLQSDYSLAYELYNEFAKQLEQAKIKVNDTKPIFTILEPVKVPVEKSEPRRMLILLLSVIMGFFVSILYLIITYFLNIDSNEITV